MRVFLVLLYIAVSIWSTIVFCGAVVEVHGWMSLIAVSLAPAAAGYALYLSLKKEIIR